jgi:photosystem II stability/assembly factor-like uncharacterized protein
MQVIAKRAVPVLLCLLVLATSARALPPPWMPLGPFGGYVRSLTAGADPATLYAVTLGGVFRTADRGLSWAAVNLRGDVTSLAADPVHAGVLYLSVQGEGVIKSTDGGAHWAPANGGLPFQNATPRAVALDPARPERLYLITSSSGLWRSGNGGASWRSGGPAGPRSIAASPVAGTAFLSANGGVYRTFDAGATWKLAGRGLPAGPADALAVAASDPRTVYAYYDAAGLFRSQDGGASWQRQTSPLSGYGDMVALAISARAPRLLYAAFSNGGLYRSADGGARWTGLGGISDVRALAAAEPRTSGTVYAGTGLTGGTLGGVWWSGDAGTTWTRRSQRLSGLPAAQVGVDPAQPDHLWTAVYGTVYRSLDRGAHWSARSAIPTDNGTWTNLVRRVAVGSASRLYAQVTRFRATNGGDNGTFLWRSADDGASWELLLGPSGDPVSAGLFDISPSMPSDLYAVAVDGVGLSSGALLRSTDGGSSWQREGSPGLVCVSGGLAVAPSSPEVLYAGGSGKSPAPYLCKPPFSTRVARSGDGGATWTDASAGLPLEVASSLAVDPGNPDVVYVSIAPGAALPEGDGVWKSTDGGQTWSRAGAGLAGRTASALLASTLSGRIYAVIDGNRVFRSDDGGASWQGWSRGLKTSAASALTADPSDPRRIYAATANGVWALTESD